MPGYGTRVLPLELVPVPGHGTQISARAPTKGSVQTEARSRAPIKSERGLICTFTVPKAPQPKSNDVDQAHNAYWERLRNLYIFCRNGQEKLTAFYDWVCHMQPSKSISTASDLRTKPVCTIPHTL